MNNVPTPTSPAHPPHSDHDRHIEDDVADDAPGQDAEQSQTTRPPSPTPALSEKTKEGLKKKLQFMTHLAMSLDTLVYAELCALYYLDCSFFRLIIRSIPQWLFLSPKAEEYVLIIPNYHVGAIVGPNLFCLLLHIITSLPHAGEASRGYLHGGILFDFVGQKAPTSKISLLLLDLLIFAIQCVMMTVNIEKERLRKVVKPRRGETATDGMSQETGTTTTGQDHDAEERGVLRDAPIMDGADGIEMQSLGNPDDDNSRNAESEESTAFLRHRRARRAESSENLVDVLRSGNAVLSTLHVPHAVRTAWNTRPDTSDTSAAFALQNVAYNSPLAAALAAQRARAAAMQQR